MVANDTFLQKRWREPRVAKYFALYAVYVILIVILANTATALAIPAVGILITLIVIGLFLYLRKQINKRFVKPGSPYLFLFFVSWISGAGLQMQIKNSAQRFDGSYEEFQSLYLAQGWEIQALGFLTLAFLIIWFVIWSQSRRKMRKLLNEGVCEAAPSSHPEQRS